MGHSQIVTKNGMRFYESIEIDGSPIVKIQGVRTGFVIVHGPFSQAELDVIRDIFKTLLEKPDAP